MKLVTVTSLIRFHVHSRQGMYTLVRYDKDLIHCKTKHREFVFRTNDFKCLAGKGFFYDPSTVEYQEMYEFINLMNKLKMEKPKNLTKKDILNALSEAYTMGTRESNHIYEADRRAEKVYDHMMNRLFGTRVQSDNYYNEMELPF